MIKFENHCFKIFLTHRFEESEPNISSFFVNGNINTTGFRLCLTLRLRHKPNSRIQALTPNFKSTVPLLKEETKFRKNFFFSFILPSFLVYSRKY